MRRGGKTEDRFLVLVLPMLKTREKRGEGGEMRGEWVGGGVASGGVRGWGCDGVGTRKYAMILLLFSFALFLRKRR